MIAPITNEPGVYDIAEADYHADPCPEPSLSSSIGHKLISRSPRHAWTAHPRLNPDHEPAHKKAFDFGHAAHKLVLGKGADIEVIEAKNYQTNAAKALRDDCYKAGLIPILAHDYERAQAMAAACERQLEAFGSSLGDPDKAERTLVWQEGDVWCRARVDYFEHDEHCAIITDYKTSSGSAHPDAVAQRLYETGGDFQANFYTRGAMALSFGGYDHAEFRFIVQENDPPYALTVIALDGQAWEMASARVDEALRLWTHCLEHDDWPGYPDRVCYIEAPVGHRIRWDAYELRQEYEKREGAHLREVAMQGQSPL